MIVAFSYRSGNGSHGREGTHGGDEGKDDEGREHVDTKQLIGL